MSCCSCITVSGLSVRVAPWLPTPGSLQEAVWHIGRLSKMEVVHVETMVYLVMMLTVTGTSECVLPVTS